MLLLEWGSRRMRVGGQEANDLSKPYARSRMGGEGVRSQVTAFTQFTFITADCECPFFLLSSFRSLT